MKPSLSKIYLRITIFSIPFILLIYWLTNQTIPNADKTLQSRGIETPIKLWLNGYLGCFFSFNYLGNINWLLLILLPLYIYYQKQMNQKIIISYSLGKILLTYFLMSFIVIAIKGYFNMRYKFTLLPFLIFFVFYFHWLITSSDVPMKRWKKFFALFLLVLNMLNYYYYSFNRYYSKFIEKFNDKLRKTLNVSITKNISLKQQSDYEFNFEKVYKSHNIFNFINNLKDNYYFLVDCSPEFYYRSTKKGYYYWSKHDVYYSENGMQKLFTNEHINKIKIILLKKMQCKYIFTSKAYFGHNKTFDEFTLSNCKLIAYDDNGYMLFEIIE